MRWLVAAALMPMAMALAPPANAQQEAIYGQGVAPDPQTTNVPYVAWRGEQIRAVKCDDSLEGAENADALVEEWSGTPDGRPQIEYPAMTFFESSEGEPCVAFDAVTLQDGLARVKLVVSDADGTLIVKHQFLMIWLTLGDLSIHEVAASDPTGGPVGSQNEVGDPLGDGHFNAGSRNGRVQVHIDGSFPHPLGSGGRFTLPDDWATLAENLEADNNPVNDPMRWDIHDDQGKGSAHVSGWCSGGGSPFDDVDNCVTTPVGSDENGPFSNVFGQGVQAAGPFDPLRPATLLSDGRLNEHDAPMPAARIDLSIAPNSGAAGDISGVGSLDKADKSTVYSRNGNGSGNAHNLYAPYNQQWIPATSRPYPEASGIDGPVQGNNFPGFLVNEGEGGLYDNWDIAATLRSAAWIETQCNRTIDFGASPPFSGDEQRVQPYGPQSVVVYTDEHGEAQVEYEPYAYGFYYDQLPVIRNANRGCDLQGIDVLGTSDISAVARYPYQPVSAQPSRSGTLRKTVHSLFDKSLSYYPKGDGEANGNARILVAHAQDVDGEPFAGERVCFYVGDLADGSRGYTGYTGPAAAPFYVGGAAAPSEGGAICRYLDSNGNAAVEVFNSDPELVNVIVEYMDQGIVRSIDLAFGTPGSSGGNPPANNGGGNGPLPPVDTAAAPQGAAPPAAQVPQSALTAPVAPTVAQVLAAGAPQNTTGAVKKIGKTKRVVVARVVQTKTGSRHLMVHVKSPNKTARIKIKVGKRTVVRRVKTNRLVRVKSLSVPKGAKVKVTLG